MRWLGLDWNEGPFFQMQRLARYKEVAEQLIAAGHAYYDYMSREELEALRQEQLRKNLKPKYDGRWRPDRARGKTPPKGVAPVVRFVTPESGEVSWNDLVKGPISFPNAELDDLVLLRADGVPTYNFGVVVDDLDMDITHVIRGDDHLNNTPRQMNILRALGAEPPLYAHVPMILGEDGKRLSKRHGAVSVMAYHEEGFLPEAVLNYLVRLGWSHGDQEIFSLEEMIRLFDVRDVNNSATAFNMSKLLWLNQHYIKESRPEHIAPQLAWQLGRLGIDPACGGPELSEVVVVQRERAKTLKEMAEISAYFYQDFADYEADAAKKHLTAAAHEPLARVRTTLAELDSWAPEPLHQAVIATAEALAIKLGKLAQPLRVAVSGRGATPGIDQTLYLIGREAVLRRIDRAVAWIGRQDSLSTAEGTP
jgi:glutamyl-tRNA synthetase